MKRKAPTAHLALFRCIVSWPTQKQRGFFQCSSAEQVREKELSTALFITAHLMKGSVTNLNPPLLHGPKIHGTLRR